MTQDDEEVWYVPVTPGGTPVPWGAGQLLGELVAARTKDEALANLMRDAAHMPYPDKAAFIKRGYTIEKWTGWSP